MSGQGMHRSENNLVKYANWCRGWINRQTNRNWVDDDHIEIFESQKEEFDQSIDQLLEKYVGSGQLPPVGNEGNWVFYKLKDMAADPSVFTWDAWLDMDQDLTWRTEDGSEGEPLGYGGKLLLSSTLLMNDALLSHRYSDIPPSVKLALSSVVQGTGDAEKKVYVGNAEARVIDAISSVPHLDPSLGPQEFSELVYTGNMSDDEWQRVVDVKRIQDISSFIGAEDSYIFNPVLLYVDKNNPYLKETKKLNGKGEIEISFDFLLERKEGFVDYVPKPGQGDVRPVKIVDGQHRVRGLAMSERGHLLNLPFVLIVGDNLDEDRALIAKIFTEINTKSVQIEPLHKLYLMHKFAMKGLTSSDDFRIDEDGNPTTASRPQRRAYELALYLCSLNGSPLEDMIEFQRPAIKGRRRPYHICVNSVSWTASVRKWFTAGKIYGDWATDDIYQEEVLNFFRAFQTICSVNWEDEPRWSPGKGRGKPLLQFEGPFLSILELYPRIVDNLLNQGRNERPLSRDVFVEYMRPLMNVDWLAPEILNSPLKGRTNLNIRHLVLWMETALENGVVREVDEILDRELNSDPGAGIIARPEGVDIEYMTNERWPQGSTVQLRVTYPEHTLGSSWTVRFYDANGTPKTWDFDKRENASASSTGSELSISSSDIDFDVQRIEVDAELFNAMGPIPLKRRSMTKPE